MTHQSPKKYAPNSKLNAEENVNTVDEQRPDHASANAKPNKESGGPSGPEPTRYGDWERKGRCIDF